MKVLITGATGLIGQELGLSLFKNGHEIVVVSRDEKKAKLQLPFPCEVIEGDLGEGLIQHPLLSSIEAVIHLMGEGVANKRWNKEQKTKIYNSRILGTRNLVASFKKAPKIFISASAIGIYGDRGDELLDENAPAGKGFLADVCTGWEKEVDDMKDLGDTRIVKARLGAVLSRQGGALTKMLPAFQAGVGGAVGSGRQWMSWIHIQDVISLFIEALENSQWEGAFNFVAPEPVTNKDFSKKLAQKLKRSLGPAVPPIALKALFGEMAEEVLLASQRVKPQKALQKGFRFQFSNADAALSDLLQYHAAGEEVLEQKQYLPLKIDDVFEFFSEAQNLERITPDTLRFHILEVSTPQIQEGTIIDYKLKIQGVPVKWRTLIEKWNPPFMFVDQALKSPYQFWYHTHTFETLGSGTLMKDQVRYRLPLGKIGWLAAYQKVSRDVRQIFDFRRKAVAEILKFR